MDVTADISKKEVKKKDQYKHTQKIIEGRF